MSKSETDALGESATSALLVEHARAVTQIEEARFAAAQTRAIALLAVAGVLAGLGTGLLNEIGDRDYAATSIGGHEVQLIPVLLIALGSSAAGALAWSAASIVGALRAPSETESHAAEFDRFLSTDAKRMLDHPPSHAAAVILALLAKQRQMARAANEEADKAFARTIRRLGSAVLCGLLVAAIMLFESLGGPRESHSFKANENFANPAAAPARLEIR